APLGEGMALNYRHLGLMLAGTGRPAEAEQYFVKSLGLHKKVVDESGQKISYKVLNQAVTHRCLGNLFRDNGRGEEAEAAYQEALALHEKLVAGLPKDADFQLELARLRSDRGNL